MGDFLGHTVRKSPSKLIFLFSIISWVVLGGSSLNFRLETTQILAVGLFVCGVVVSAEEFFQGKTVSGNGLFPLIISLAMVLNPVSDYGLLLITGLFSPMIFLIGKLKWEAVGRRAFAGTLTALFFTTLFLLSGVTPLGDRAAIFAFGAILLSFVPFMVRLNSIDSEESAWKGIVLHQAVLRISVILLAPISNLSGEGAGLRSVIFFGTLLISATILINAWVRRQQRIWDCTFQSLLSLLVVNFASLETLGPMDWMAGATLTSLAMSLVPTKRPSDNQNLFSQIMIASENGSMGGAIFLFLVGALVSAHSGATAEMTIAQALLLIGVGITGWVFVPSNRDENSLGVCATPKSVFHALSILSALAMAGYKYMDAVARRIDV